MVTAGPTITLVAGKKNNFTIDATAPTGTTGQAATISLNVYTSNRGGSANVIVKFQ